MKTTPARLAGVVVALLVAASIQILFQTATAAPAAAVAGLVRVQSPTPVANTTTVKTAKAICPSGTRAVGGGGWAFDNDAFQVHLTGLIPETDGYRANAEASPGFTGSWWLQAYALCAPTPAGLEIRTSTQQNPASNPFVSGFVDCPSGKELLGTGAAATSGTGRVGLQMNDTLGGRTRAHSGAHEIAAGYSGSWALTTYAVCANPVAGATSFNKQVSGSGGFANCPAGTRIHSVTGGGPLFDAGPVLLQVLFPSSSLSQVEVFLTGAPSHNITNVGAICAP